jgi:hypothetical protein
VIWKKNQIKDWKKNSSHTLKMKMRIPIVKCKISSSSYTPYEDISATSLKVKLKSLHQMCNNISSNMFMRKMLQQFAMMHIDDEKSQEHLQQEELVEEINLENNDGQDFIA